MASSSSSTIMASSSEGDKACVYDVFLSFRGEDTRHNFTDHLYVRLQQEGIYPFRDDEEINRGEKLAPEIERAIKKSKGSIIVLSKNYATSCWCLDELRLILEQKKCGHFVLPIFYGVEPTDVRNQKQSFGIKVKPSSRWTDDNVNIWTTALKNVADLSGEVVSGPETSSLDKIVDIIYNKLGPKDVLLPTNIIGMDTHYEYINSWFKQSNLNILAIYGMGGSGKTTLAKYIYNLYWKTFEYVSFVENVGTRCKNHYGLLEVQEQLLKDILRRKEGQIRSVFHGTPMIGDALQKKKALIVLDDIVGPSQLIDLVGTGEINAESKIIITTTEDTDNWPDFPHQRCRKYNMRLLNDNESSKLLCRRVFRSEIPKEGFEEVVLRAVQYCEGNPLALEVLGSHLFNINTNTIQFWDSQLNSFEKDLHSRIRKVLKRSYKSLPDVTVKGLFLHIACFFNGIDMDYVEKILECDYSALSGIKTLTNRSLLSISPTKKLTMHKLVQEMGKDIVRRESRVLAKRSRIWINKDSYNILRKGNGSIKVEGLALDMKMLSKEDSACKQSELKTEAFKNMGQLKLLQLNFVELNGSSYEHFSEDLRWLCWLGFHLNTIPSDLYMGNLVAIDMSYSKLKDFKPPTVLSSLRILNLKDSHNLTRIHDIFNIPNLETLILWNCYSLVYVCNTLGDLKRLALLNMTGCNTLGDHEGPTFSFPFSLRQLFLKDCHLDCTDSFPLSFSDQIDLQYLNLGNNRFKSLPCYDHLKNLRVLDLSFCSQLKCLIDLPSTVLELYVYYCESLEKITFQSHQFTLQEFGYLGCIRLFEVEGFIKLVPIAELPETDLGHMKWLQEYQNHHQVCLVGDDELTQGRSWHIQMLFEFGIMSTSLPVPDIKNRIIDEYISESTSLSFTVPLCPKNKKLIGINVTVKYELSGDNWNWFCRVSTPNGSTTNGVNLIYNPKVFGKPEVGEECIWLSYWPIGKKLNTGDSVLVSIVEISGLKVHECGVSLVYSDQETLENNIKWEEIMGGDFSGFLLSTGAYYLCRRDFFELMDVGRLTPDWFRILVGNSVDHTEVRGWRKTGRPIQVHAPSVTELKFVRCIIHGPQLEDIYKIAERSKSSFDDKPVAFTSSLLEKEITDKAMEYKAGDETVDDLTTEESDSYSHGREIEMEVERESVILSLTDELIKAACILSMKAHGNQHYVTDTMKHGGASSSSSMEVSVIAFKGSMEVEHFYQDDHFGETNVDCNMFPSLQHIGEGQLAKVNGSILQLFENLLFNSTLKLEVEKAIKEDKKILFTGHSSGGAIASLATLWMLDEYIRKQKIRLPIGCVTFGSPLIGDRTLTHAVQREKWAGHFTHFVMEHDIVPRMMLAPKTSMEEHLPIIFKFFSHKVNPIMIDRGLKAFQQKVNPITIDHLVDGNQAGEFFEHVLINSSTVASHDACELMESTNSLKENLSISFIKVSPYRPFGIYIFCTQGDDMGRELTPRQQLVVENPNAVLQLLFYFLQLPNEDQNLSEFALKSLNENFGYEQELNKNGLLLEKRVDLKHLNEHLWTSNGNTGDAIRTSDKALYELVASAKWCLLAAEEAEKRKKKNEEQVILSMRKYTSNKLKNKSKIIEDLIDEILKYKEKHGDGSIDYYEAFKLQNENDDFIANVNRLEQAKIWDVVIEMVRRKDLPDDFEAWGELVDLATQSRRVFEPLEIANYYRHISGGTERYNSWPSYLNVRPKRYKFIQRWYEHANVTRFESISESNFVAEVEELMGKVEELMGKVVKRMKTFEEVNKDLEIIKKEVKKWQSDAKIQYKDVYWGDSVLSKLQEILASSSQG